MRLVTVVNREHAGLTLWKTSAENHGFKPEILGLNDSRPLGHSHNAFGVKFMVLAAFLKTISPDDLCLVTDGFDVVIADSHDRLQARILRNLQHHKLLFCAELYENPDQGMPWQANRLPYLNAGVYAGKAGDILNSLIPFFKLPLDSQIVTDDQRYWTHYYFGHPDIIKIDHNGDVFACLLDVKERSDAGVLHFQGFYKDLSHLSATRLWNLAKAIHRPRTLLSSIGDNLTSFGLLALPVLGAYPRIVPCITGFVLVTMLLYMLPL